MQRLSRRVHLVHSSLSAPDMPAILYPSALPCPVVSVTKPAERRSLSDLPGQRQSRLLSRGYLATERVEWVLKQSQADALRAWYDTTLHGGGAWFAAEWPSPQGGWLDRRFTAPLQWSYIHAGTDKRTWRVAGECEVRPYMSGTGRLPDPPPPPPTTTYWLLDTFSGPEALLKDRSGEIGCDTWTPATAQGFGYDDIREHIGIDGAGTAGYIPGDFLITPFTASLVVPPSADFYYEVTFFITTYGPNKGYTIDLFAHDTPTLASSPDYRMWVNFYHSTQYGTSYAYIDVNNAPFDDQKYADQLVPFAEDASSHTLRMQVTEGRTRATVFFDGANILSLASVAPLQLNKLSFQISEVGMRMDRIVAGPL